MKLIYRGLLSLSAISLLSLGSCKKYRDINTNPNNPESVDIKLLLPSAEANIAQQVGGKFQIIGGMWSQYWTQNPTASQYRTFDQYQIASSDINNAWNGLYSDALMDLQKIIELSGTQKNYGAIAKILQGYTFQVLTDQFGDIPFSEALKGESDNVTSPHYDKQEDVYKGIIALVEEGMAELDPASTTPGSDDLIYHGDLNEWQKFGNTLLLKMYMRLSLKSPGMAAAGINALYASGIGFLAEGETAKITYGSAAGSFNPLYSEMNNAVINKIQNLVASSTVIDSMNSNGDPRVAIFYAPGTGGYVGNDQGFYNTTVQATTFAIPSAAVGGDANDPASAVAPVIFISDYESLFLQAEAAVRGWGDGDDAALFQRAVAANFKAYEPTFNSLIDVVFSPLVADSIATSDTTGYPFEYKYDLDYATKTYLNGDSSLLAGTNYYLEGEPVTYTPASYWGQYPARGSVEERIEFIITQKWFSMCGNQNIEAWTEWRRTGYPSFFVVSVNSRIGNNFPQRFLYPDDEVSNNANFPGQKTVTDKVWWDIN